MFITIQFPLFDKWGLMVTENRATIPSWRDISTTLFVKNIGAIINSPKRFNSPLDSDTYYCNATSVLNLCGLSSNNFYESLRNAENIKSKIMFRRFQADSYFMAKFEIGFADSMEQFVDENQEPDALKALFFRHISTYLDCQLKIKVGTKLGKYVALGQSTKYLKQTYYWSTIVGKKDFNEKDPNAQIEGLNPNLIVQVDANKFPLEKFGFEKVKISGIADEILELYYGQIKFQNTKYFDIWVIGTKNQKEISPYLQTDFTGFSTELKRIRTNLLEIPVQAAILQKITAKIQDLGINPKLSDISVQYNIGRFLVNSIDKLSKNLRNKISQTDLIKTILKPNGEIEENENPLKEKIKIAFDWFKTLPSHPDLDNMKLQFEQKYAELLDEKPKKTIYISSTFRDLKDYRADLIKLFQNELSKQFELSQIMEKMYDDGDFTPFSEDCTAAVGKSDIYLIILGNKVGSFPPNETRTYTEIELDFAILNQKKMFCFMVDPFDEKEISDKAKHDEIIGKFKGRPTHKFKNYSELENLLLKHLYQLAFD
jgi:hypothetical protein